MGIFTNHFLASIGDNQKIEVEARIGWMGVGEYDLIINGEKVDSIRGSLGKFFLRGKIRRGGEYIPVKVVVHQKLLSTNAYIQSGGEEIPMGESIPVAL